MDRPRNVSDMLEVRGGFSRGLFAHSKSAAQFAHGHAIRSNRLKGKTMYRPRLIVSVTGEFSVQFVDERPECTEEEQWQFESGPFSHLSILAHLVLMDNSVYHIDNAVV
jgi:hypothetical protein